MFRNATFVVIARPSAEQGVRGVQAANCYCRGPGSQTANSTQQSLAEHVIFGSSSQTLMTDAQQTGPPDDSCWEL
jgi:hypothetical protein